jgi:thymidylate synthase ThyX
MITATVIQDSISSYGTRLTTLSLTYPRFILAELNTHRMLSRNSASSRAIPTHKLLTEIIDNPAMPVEWGKNKPGMHADESIGGLDEIFAKAAWIEARNQAVAQAKKLTDLKVHKQVVNRILEPFMHARTVVTATDWTNFYTLRRAKDAQPEIKQLADAMWEAMDTSCPEEVPDGGWHLPYADSLKCSVARCARVSYLTHENKTPVAEKDIQFHDRLLKSRHYSPFEHQATPMKEPKYYDNFFRWKQYRMVVRESQRNSGDEKI